MDPYIDQLNAEMADVNQRIGVAYMALAGMHPDNPGFNAVCILQIFEYVNIYI